MAWKRRLFLATFPRHILQLIENQRCFRTERGRVPTSTSDAPRRVCLLKFSSRIPTGCRPTHVHKTSAHASRVNVQLYSSG